MRRPLVWMAIPVCLYCIFGAVLHVNFIFLLITSLTTFLAIYSFTKKEYMKRYLIFLGLFSVLSIVLVAFNSKESSIVSKLDADGLQAEISGRVKKLSRYDDYMYVQLSGVNVNTGTESGRLNGILLKAPFTDVGTGDIIMTSGTLLPLEGKRNEGNFDEKSYYESIGIEAVLKTKKTVESVKTKNLVYRLSDKIRRHFKKSFETVSPNYTGELSSVIIGDKSTLDTEVKELYSENGIAHILAISGLHISFAGLGLYKLLRKAGLDILSCTLISGVAVVCYVLLTGSSISAWRACVMFLFAAFADVIGRSYDPLSALSVQAMVTLLVTPKAVCGASFVMSYTAVLSIILSNEAFGNVMYRLRGSRTILRVVFSNIISAFGVFIFMLPVTLYYYSAVPVYSPFLNMLVIPLSALLMPLGMAAGFMGSINEGLGVFFAGGAERIFDIYTFACNVTQKLPFNKILPGTPGIAEVIIFYVFYAVCFLIWKKYIEAGLKTKLSDAACRLPDIISYLKVKLFVMLPGIIPLLLVIFTLLKQNSTGFFVSMIDVGQGDCILIHTQDGKNLLFDGGSSNLNHVYSKRIKPFLLSKGINRLDMIFVSHTDADHVNGLTQLLKECDGAGISKGNIRVCRLVMPELTEDLKDEFYHELVECADEKKICVDYAAKGVRYYGKSFELSCLSPVFGDESMDKNELSAVYKFTSAGFSMLLTGDMTEESEKRLLEEKADLKVDVLKGAHHGSNYSSSAAFLEAADPKLCIISCGVNNRYGHPGTETIKRLEDAGVSTFVTKECGQIFVEKQGKDYVVRTLL